MSSKEQYMDNYPIDTLDEVDYEVEMRTRAIKGQRDHLDKLDENGKQWFALMKSGYDKRYFKTYSELRSYPLAGLKVQGEEFDEDKGLWVLMYHIVDYMAANAAIPTHDKQFCYQETGAYPHRTNEAKYNGW